MTPPNLRNIQSHTDEVVDSIQLLWTEIVNLRQEVARLRDQEKQLVRVEVMVDELRTSCKENTTAIRDLSEKVGGVIATATRLEKVFFSVASRAAGKGDQPNDARAGASAGLLRSGDEGHRQCV